MEQEIMRKAMVAMCWDPDCDLPMANEENKKILKYCHELVEEKADLSEAQKQTGDRLLKLRQHTKNAEISINQNLKLLAAHQLEVQRELHLFKVADREGNKLTHDITNVTKEGENYKALHCRVEKELCKRKKAIDDLTNRVKWAKTALIEWRQAIEDGNKGTLLIEKYFKEDELLARQKDQQRQIVHDQIEKLRKHLVELYDEQITLEKNLENASKLYRSAHQERRVMVETWKTAVKTMLQRERDIQEGEVHLLELKKVAKEKDAERRQVDQQLTDIIANNRSIEVAIEELNSETSGIKEQIQLITNMIALKENEMDALQKELLNLSMRVQNQRLENRKQSREKAEKIKDLDDFQMVLAQLQERLRNMRANSMTANQRLQLLEEMNDAEDRVQAKINKDIVHFNGWKYRAEKQKTELSDEIKILEVGNSGIVVTIAAIKKNTEKTQKEMERLTEILYDLSYKCLDFERRIIVLRGGIVDPEMERYYATTYAGLEGQYAKVQKRLQATEAQNKKLDDNMRKLTDVYNSDIATLQHMAFIIKEAQVYCEGGVKRLKVEQRANQEKIVDLSMLKMRANQFESEIDSCENSTYNLEKHRLKLNRTIKDRMVEIKSQMDLLNLKRKHLEEERSTLLADIGERNKHIDVVRGRFELTSKLLGVNEDGTLVTATQLKVEVAQEKQMLLDEGDALNERVLKAEEEVKAMENTLVILTKANNKYRQSLTSTVTESEKLDELKFVQQHYCQSLKALKCIRNKAYNMEQDNEKATAVRTQLEGSLEKAQRICLENTDILEKLKKEVTDQNAKLQRAEREFKTALKAAKQRGLGPEFLHGFERDLDLREMEYRNSNALNQLADMADNDDDIGPKIIRIMAEKGLKMPHQIQKTRSFASWRSEVSDITSSSSIQSDTLSESSAKPSVVNLELFPKSSRS